MSSQNNKPPYRKSARLATKNNPQYELAARSALNSGTSSTAKNYKKQKFTVNTSNENNNILKLQEHPSHLFRQMLNKLF